MVGLEMQPKENGPDENAVQDEEMEEEEDYDDMTVEELEAINTQLDELNSALDDIEQKNDNIYSQLLQLLEANKAVRKQMQEQTQAESKNK